MLEKPKDKWINAATKDVRKMPRTAKWINNGQENLAKKICGFRAQKWAVMPQ